MSDYEFLSSEARLLVDQVTLRKLDYARSILKEVNLPTSGNKDEVRGRLANGIRKGLISLQKLESLLKELELWGDQRIRLVRLPAQEASALLNRSLCQKMAESAGFGEVFEAEHRVSENPELEMLWAEYVQFDDTPRLRIVAGKARKVDSKLVDVEEVIFPDNPEIVYVPFRRQYKNALSFLEIDLLTGDALLSTSKLAFGANYDKEFDEFIKLISGFIRVNHAGRRTLSTAVRKINGGLTGCDRHACEMHTPQQNKLLARGRSSTSDFGLDPDVLPYLVAGQLMDHVFSNCSWLPCDGLAQKVHTHIYAPKGEITIIHQVGEEEARHVLQRVEQIN